VLAFLRGRIMRLRSDQVVLETGGVGYLVSVPATALERLGKLGDVVELHLHTYVREDQLALYGFTSPDELEFFQALIQVDQVGPRVALAILSTAGLASLKRAILEDDVGLIRRAPGVGPRTAQKVIIDLKPRLLAEEGPTARPPREEAPVARQVELSLRALGYSPTEALRGLGAVTWDDSPEADLALAQALKALGR